MHYYELYQQNYVYLLTRPECSSQLFIELEELEKGRPHGETDFSVPLLVTGIIYLLI
jgi:hypothetical protein